MMLLYCVWNTVHQMLLGAKLMHMHTVFLAGHNHFLDLCELSEGQPKNIVLFRS